MLSPTMDRGSGTIPRMGQKKPIDPIQPHMDTYGEATRRQGADYDDIMGRFRNFYDEAQSGKFDSPSYESTADYKDAISNLGGLAKTGGYSAEDIANIRERSISPIRAVYGNAARNLKRQRSLQGGYSPNMAAATAKMAREQGSLLSGATTNANAQIAQNVASNRLAASTPYSSITAGEQQDRNQFAQRNAENENRFGGTGMRLSALQGMTSLYGTTPATSALQQRGALSFSDLQNQINQQNKNYDISKLRSFR